MTTTKAVDNGGKAVYNAITLNRFRSSNMGKTHAFSVRLPIDLAQKLRERAYGEHRSVNGMVVHLLSQALDRGISEPVPVTTPSLDLSSDDSLGRVSEQ